MGLRGIWARLWRRSHGCPGVSKGGLAAGRSGVVAVPRWAELGLASTVAGLVPDRALANAIFGVIRAEYEQAREAILAHLDDLQRHGLTASDVAEYYLVRSPEFLVMVIPVALLLFNKWRSMSKTKVQA